MVLLRCGVNPVGVIDVIGRIDLCRAAAGG